LFFVSLVKLLKCSFRHLAQHSQFVCVILSEILNSSHDLSASFFSIVKFRQLLVFGCLAEMDMNVGVNQIILESLSENWRQPSGCPCTTWMKNIQNNIALMGLKQHEARDAVWNQFIWRCTCSDACYWSIRLCWLWSMCTSAVISRLQSSSSFRCEQPRMWLKFWHWAFSYAALSTWNKQPTSLQELWDTKIYKQHLQTV